MFRYGFSKKKGAAWLVGAMRFRTLWEAEGSSVVAVVDIHDDLTLQTKQVRTVPLTAARRFVK